MSGAPTAAAIREAKARTLTEELDELGVQLAGCQAAASSLLLKTGQVSAPGQGEAPPKDPENVRTKGEALVTSAAHLNSDLTKINEAI